MRAISWAALAALAACDPAGYYRHGGAAGAGAGGVAGGGGGMAIFITGAAGASPTGAAGGNAGASGAAGAPISAGTAGAAAGATGAAGAVGASGAGGVASEARLTDGFEDGMTTEWIADTVNGDWAIVADTGGGAANKIYEDRKSDSTLSWAIGGKVTWTDQVVSAKVKLVSSSSSSAIIALAVRYSSADSYYFVALKPDGTFKIRKRVNGSTADVTEYKPSTKVPLVPDTWYLLGLSAVGTTLTGTLSGPGVGAGADAGAGVGMAMGTDADLKSGGIALGAQNCVAAFDDVLVAPPP